MADDNPTTAYIREKLEAYEAEDQRGFYAANSVPFSSVRKWLDEAAAKFPEAGGLAEDDGRVPEYLQDIERQLHEAYVAMGGKPIAPASPPPPSAEVHVNTRDCEQAEGVECDWPTEPTSDTVKWFRGNAEYEVHQQLDRLYVEVPAAEGGHRDASRRLIGQADGTLNDGWTSWKRTGERSFGVSPAEGGAEVERLGRGKDGA